MAVILLILKIIGIILLAVLGLILILLAVILFVPVRYRVMGSIREKDTLVRGSVYWLLHSISYMFVYQDGEMESCLKILGIRQKSRRGEAEEAGEEAEAGEPDENAETAGEPDGNAEAAKKPDGNAEVAETEEKTKTAEKDAKPEQKVQGRQSVFERIRQKVNDILETIRRMTEKIRKLLTNLPEKIKDIKNIKNVLMDETIKNALVFIWRELLYLLRHFKFRRIHTDLEFSMGDPALTGQVLGGIAVFPAIYQYDIHICPDFEAEELYVRGDFSIQGRIRLIHLLCSCIRLIKEKDVRSVLARFRK
ncbi:MAG: DUF2953 domain-containing protein [Roseburia sp.]